MWAETVGLRTRPVSDQESVLVLKDKGIQNINPQFWGDEDCSSGSHIFLFVDDGVQRNTALTEKLLQEKPKLITATL